MTVKHYKLSTNHYYALKSKPVHSNRIESTIPEGEQKAQKYTCFARSALCTGNQLMICIHLYIYLYQFRQNLAYCEYTHVNFLHKSLILPFESRTYERRGWTPSLVAREGEEEVSCSQTKPELQNAAIFRLFVQIVKTSWNLCAPPI